MEKRHTQFIDGIAQDHFAIVNTEDLLTLLLVGWMPDTDPLQRITQVAERLRSAGSDLADQWERITTEYVYANGMIQNESVCITEVRN